MNLVKLVVLVLAVSVTFGATTAGAQAPSAPPAPPAYGPAISLEQAKKAVAGAEAEARKNNWYMAIMILDPGGHLVMMQRMDNTQIGSIEVARQKAYSAVAFRRPTKVFEDLVAQGGANLRLLRLEGASPVEGGVPIVMDGKIVGAIGVSGGTSQQDGQVAKAGLDAMTK